MKQFERATKERLIRYAKINTRSDINSDTVPSTKCQLDLSHLLVEELKALGMSQVYFNEENAFVTATLPANIEEEVPTIGFIAHVDTADFPSENVQPQVFKKYDGSDLVLNERMSMRVADFPQLMNYLGQDLITTDGTTLLGADDKAGIAEIMTAMEYLIQHPEIPHGDLRVAFGPDEEIGRGADRFDVKAFNADFAYTMDGGPVGELQYESFNAAAVDLEITGVSVHPGTAKDQMINAITVMNDFIQALPPREVPEHTDGREGFYLVTNCQGEIGQACVSLIIRDHDKNKFLERCRFVEDLIETINDGYDQPPIRYELYDQYYNMEEILRRDMTPVDVAVRAMEKIGITPNLDPIRGGTDGSKLSFMGLPTPNIFAGGENYHGPYEFVSTQAMALATQVIIEIVQEVTHQK